MRLSSDDMLRKHRYVVRTPGHLIVDPTMNRPVFAERLAHHHPYEDHVPFPKRRDFLSAERVRAGTVSFSLRKSARAISA
jgi:hypothetical protein